MVQDLIILQHRGLELLSVNHYGDFLVALSKRFPYFYTAEHIEALAALQAIQLAIQFNFASVELEGDCLSVLNSLKCDGEDLSSIGEIIEAAKLELANLQN